MIGLLSALVLATASAPSTPLPQDSLHHLSATMTDQHGRRFELAGRRGRVQLVTMFYSSCAFACPLIIDSVKAIDRALTPEEKDKLDLLVVSFDPERDTVEKLKQTATQRKLPAPRWTFARTDDGTVRKLAALLDVQYRKLEDGEFNHTNVLSLVDAEGRIVARTEMIGVTPDPEFLKKVRETLAAEKRPTN